MTKDGEKNFNLCEKHSHLKHSLAFLEANPF